MLEILTQNIFTSGIVFDPGFIAFLIGLPIVLAAGMIPQVRGGWELTEGLKVQTSRSWRGAARLGRSAVVNALQLTGAALMVLGLASWYLPVWAWLGTAFR